MRIKLIVAFATGLVLVAAQKPASAETVWSLYESACMAHGIDSDQCLCIFGQVSDNHSDDAVHYLALDMNLRYDEASSLLEKIGEDEAFAVGMTFDEAQNLNCSSSRLAQLKGTYQNAGTGEAVASAVVAEQADDATLVDVISEPLHVLRAPHPLLDFSAIKGDVNVMISVIMSSELIKASTGENTRPHLAVYEVVDPFGGVDLSGNGKADIAPDAPGYASAVQSRALSPKLNLPQQGDGEQVLGNMQLKGGSMYAPFVKLKLADRATNPPHLHFAFPLGQDGDSGALVTVGDNSFALDLDDVNTDGIVQAEDMLFTISVLNSPQELLGSE